MTRQADELPIADRFDRMNGFLARRRSDSNDTRRNPYERWQMSRMEALHRALDANTERESGAQGRSEPRIEPEYDDPYLHRFIYPTTEPSSPVNPFYPMDVEVVADSRLRHRSSIPEAPRMQARTLSGPGFDDVRTGYTPPVSRNPTMNSPPVLPPLGFTRSRPPVEVDSFDDFDLAGAHERLAATQSNLLGILQENFDSIGVSVPRCFFFCWFTCV